MTAAHAARRELFAPQLAALDRIAPLGTMERMRYGMALISSTVVLTLLPCLLYVVAIVVANDIGGPFNLIFVPVLSAMAAFGASLCVLLPLLWIGERFSIPRWVLALVVLPGLSLLIWSPVIGYYGFGAEELVPLSSLFGIAGGMYVYLLVGLLSQFTALTLVQVAPPWSEANQRARAGAAPGELEREVAAPARVVSREEVRELDRRAIHELGIPGAVLMENAGRNAASEILALLASEPTLPRRAAILCGPGNNGGDGYVIARHLHNAGVEVELFSTVPVERLAGEAALYRAICERMQLRVASIASADEIAAVLPRWASAGVVVDALLGTGSEGEVREPIATSIREANELRGPRRVAIDLPSGLDANTGLPGSPTFRADLTVTFVAHKRGFLADLARPYLGRVVVADIGAPLELLGPR